MQEQGITPEDEHIQLVKLEHSFVQDGKLPHGEKPDTPGGVRIAGVTGFRTCGKTGLVPQDAEQDDIQPAETVWLGGERVRIVPLQGKTACC